MSEAPARAEQAADGHRFGYIAIAGRPNAGKSTLINALIGEKVAITSRLPQTTRTTIEGILTRPDAQIVFVDTPGIHKSDSLLNKRMMDAVRAALEGRDLVMFVADATRPLSVADEQALDSLRDAPSVLVLNKIDRLADKRELLPLIQAYTARRNFVEVVPTSARTGEGLSELQEALVRHLPYGVARFTADQFTTQTTRFLAAELIREQVLQLTRQEVPHSVAVLVEGWEEMPRLVRIAVTLFVERPGQQAILIGKGGATMKRVGTQARAELEALLGKKVYLDLAVKRRPGWREDPLFLRYAAEQPGVAQPHPVKHLSELDQ